MSVHAFVSAARELLGVKWRHRGRSLRGVDCVGLVALAGQRSALPNAIDVSGYGREPWDDQLRKGCDERWGAPVDDVRAGDIVLVRWGVREPSHLAIVGDHPLGGLTVIHAHTLHGVIEQRLDARLRKAVVAVYRPWEAARHVG